MLFAPLLPAVQILKLIVLFYMKKVGTAGAMTSCSVPSKICMLLNILLWFLSSEQPTTQLSGLQKALEGQSDDNSVHLSVVLPLVSRSCRVCHVYNLDVSATNRFPSFYWLSTAPPPTGV